MKLSIVIVNTNEWKVLKPCLTSVLDQTSGFPYEVIVVDNGSTDESRQSIPLEFPQVRLVCNERNLGFAASNNRGFSVATGEYVLMLNPDTVVTDRAISRTLAFMEKHPSIGIAGCRLRLPDNSIQASAGSFPSLWYLFCETFFLERLFSRTRLFGSYNLTWFDFDESRKVDWVCGAYLMMRRSVLEAVGSLDEQFYMYTEEVDYCFRARKLGFEVWYYPSAEVLHFWGGRNAATRRTILWTTGSQLLFFQKHHRDGARWALVGLRYAGIVLRVPVFFTLGVLSLNKRLVDKASYFLYAAHKLVTTPWKYDHHQRGEIRPWTEK